MKKTYYMLWDEWGWGQESRLLFETEEQAKQWAIDNWNDDLAGETVEELWDDLVGVDTWTVYQG